MNDLDTKKRCSLAISVIDIPRALQEYIEAIGYDVASMTPADKAVIADRLSRVAGVSPAWTWRYVHNVLLHKIEASKRFSDALLSLLSIEDGANPLMVGVRQVQVYARNVKPGALILADSRACANPHCPVEFVPRVPRQRFCSAECRKNSRH